MEDFIRYYHKMRRSRDRWRWGFAAMVIIVAVVLWKPYIAEAFQ